MMTAFQVESHRTLGFGPFALHGWPILPDVVSVRLHRALQTVADREVAILRKLSTQLLFLAKKPAL